MNAENYILEEIAKETAQTASMIEHVINMSNDKKLLYHGIKERKNVKKIIEEGLKPLTPESGHCSFWSTGLALSYPFIDSSFFGYSGGSSLNTCELNIAITSYNLLLEKGFSLEEYVKDSQIRIETTVPYEAMTIISVSVKHQPSETHKNLREYRRIAEQTLLAEIKTQTLNKFITARIIRIQEEVEKYNNEEK